MYLIWLPNLSYRTDFFESAIADVSQIRSLLPFLYLHFGQFDPVVFKPFGLKLPGFWFCTFLEAPLEGFPVKYKTF